MPVPTDGVAQDIFLLWPVERAFVFKDRIGMTGLAAPNGRLLGPEPLREHGCKCDLDAIKADVLRL
ncbi:hypothetical protein GCM10007921_32460 [Tritonibacter mobilis]|nr:hypothetical protein GCM10007921_32460 [Tritonibacter mobilis]